MKQEAQWRVGSVAKALQILNCFSYRRTEISLTQISQELEIPKSTAYNLVKTLVSEQFLRKSENSSNYLPGIRLLTLGSRHFLCDPHPGGRDPDDRGDHLSVHRPRR